MTTKAEELAKVYQQVAKRAAKVLNDFAKSVRNSARSATRSALPRRYMDLYARMLADPMALATNSVNMWLDYAQLWQSG